MVYQEFNFINRISIYTHNHQITKALNSVCNFIFLPLISFVCSFDVENFARYGSRNFAHGKIWINIELHPHFLFIHCSVCNAVSCGRNGVEFKADSFEVYQKCVELFVLLQTEIRRTFEVSHNHQSPVVHVFICNVFF